MWPFEQTIAMQGQQALVPSPTQDPNEIATRQGAFLPFVEKLKSGLQTPQGQMAALMIAQQMLQSRAPGEANGALPRLVDGALQGMGAIAQYNQNMQQAAVQQQEMGLKQDQIDVTRRGQDVQARGQDVQKEISAFETDAANERNAADVNARRYGIDKQAEASAADTQARLAGVDAQREATRLQADIDREKNAIAERQILQTAEAARLKYGLDNTEESTKLVTEATKAAMEATGMGQGTFDLNFRNIYNNMATAAGKTGIPGAPPSADHIKAGVAAAQKAAQNNIDPNAIIDQLAREADRKFGIDGAIYAEEIRKALAAAPPPAAAPAAPPPTSISLPQLFSSQPAAPAPQMSPDQEIIQIQQQLAADDNIKKEVSGSVGRAIQTRTMPLGIAERKALENRLKELQNAGNK